MPHPAHSFIDLETYRYGEAGSRKGLFIGAARHLPRGLRRADYATQGYFDVWLPALAPDRKLVAAYRDGRITCRQFFRRYRREMHQLLPQQIIRLVAAVARCQPVYLGCFCTDAALCHRSVLKELVEDAAAALPSRPGKAGEFFSPACAMPEIED
jgi:uncharacterized protein YeaO (DUF488 family)